MHPPHMFQRVVIEMYFSSQHNEINIKNIRDLHTQIESIENELNIALKQLDNHTVSSVEISIFRCIATLHSINDEIMAMANCLQEISNRYENTETEIIRDIRNLPTDNIFDNTLNAVSESLMTLSPIQPIIAENKYQGKLQTAYSFGWRREGLFFRYIKYFPVVFPMIEDIPEQWLQIKLYNWIANKNVNQAMYILPE